MITTINKSTKKTIAICAGISPSDHSLEFIGIRKTKQVLWLQNGCTHRFEDLPGTYYQLLFKAYYQDKSARNILNDQNRSLERQIELYTYYMFGDFDSIPDMLDGKLNFSENFRDTENCISLKFDNKEITIGSTVLNSRDVQIIDLIKQDLPDKEIASKLPNRNGKKGVSQQTLDFHKRNLFKKIGVQTKVGLVTKTLNAGI